MLTRENHAAREFQKWRSIAPSHAAIAIQCGFSENRENHAAREFQKQRSIAPVHAKVAIQRGFKQLVESAQIKNEGNEESEIGEILIDVGA